MKPRACTNHGKKMFKITVPNGKYPNGKPRYATLFRDTKTECKEAALEYLKAEEAAIKSLRKKKRWVIVTARYRSYGMIKLKIKQLILKLLVV